jgi:hypothetical protein
MKVHKYIQHAKYGYNTKKTLQYTSTVRYSRICPSSHEATFGLLLLRPLQKAEPSVDLLPAVVDLTVANNTALASGTVL